MQTNTFTLHKNYTLFGQNYQLVLPLEIEHMIPEDDSVRLLSRNSYSKTDPDATFMRMKEDAMGNGQLKAGYNLQHGVDSEYIVWLSIGPQPSDITTLIPFLKEKEKNLGLSYQKVTADLGYESEENYMKYMQSVYH